MHVFLLSRVRAGTSLRVFRARLLVQRRGGGAQRVRDLPRGRPVPGVGCVAPLDGVDQRRGGGVRRTDEVLRQLRRDSPRQSRGRVAPFHFAVGPRAEEQEVEDAAQGVHVDFLRQGVSPRLLGAPVVWREHLPAERTGPSLLLLLGRRVPQQQLPGVEIEQLGGPVDDRDVVGFEIGVHGRATGYTVDVCHACGHVRRELELPQHRVGGFLDLFHGARQGPVR
mmetsp:Transcript_48738/g.95277  ORF Transcript_48738/g.95277 Transcript_48738/m.95277 type:complete len:224 (-) Transcript_48738:627-1298(-)